MKIDKEKWSNLKSVLLIQVVLYIIQYIIMPLFYTPQPWDLAACVKVLCISTVVIAYIGQLIVKQKLRYWLASFLIYPLLVFIYHPHDIYSIGYEGFRISFPDGFYIIIYSLVLLVFEMITCGVINIIGYWMNKDNEKNK